MAPPCLGTHPKRHRRHPGHGVKHISDSRSTISDVRAFIAEQSVILKIHTLTGAEAGRRRGVACGRGASVKMTLLAFGISGALPLTTSSAFLFAPCGVAAFSTRNFEAFLSMVAGGGGMAILYYYYLLLLLRRSRLQVTLLEMDVTASHCMSLHDA